MVTRKAVTISPFRPRRFFMPIRSENRGQGSPDNAVTLPDIVEDANFPDYQTTKDISMIDFYALTSPNVQKIYIMLEETKLPYKEHFVDLWQGDQFNPDFLRACEVDSGLCCCHHFLRGKPQCESEERNENRGDRSDSVPTLVSDMTGAPNDNSADIGPREKEWWHLFFGFLSVGALLTVYASLKNDDERTRQVPTRSQKSLSRFLLLSASGSSLS